MIALASQSPTAAQWPAEHYEQAINIHQPKRVVLVAEENDGMVAFLMGRLVFHEWELENIVTAWAARRQGIASRILAAFIAIARQEVAGTIFLEVRESNRAARAFYEKWAFEKAGRRANYYSDPREDALVYRLKLP